MVAQVLVTDDLTSVDTWKGVVAETIAVFVLVLVGTGIIVVANAVGKDPIANITAIAVGMGLTYMALVALTAGISGGHINPAVTLAAVVSGRMSVTKGLLYAGGQIGGAVAGSFILSMLLVDKIEGELGAVMWNSGVLETLGAAFVVELVLGFVLVFVMLALIVGPGPSNAPAIAPLGPGLIVLVGTLLAWALTGAAMNPARALGPAIAANFWTDHWIYWAGPLAGSVVAVLIYDGVFTGRLSRIGR